SPSSPHPSPPPILPDTIMSWTRLIIAGIMSSVLSRPIHVGGPGSIGKEVKAAKLAKGGCSYEEQPHADDCYRDCTRQCLWRQLPVRPGQVHLEGAGWARVLRVQGLRNLASCLRQSERRPGCGDPR